MNKAILILLIFAFLLPSAQASVRWMNFETHTLYETSDFEKYQNPVENWSISSGTDKFAIWNESTIYLFPGGEFYHLEGIRNVWIGGGRIGVMLNNGSFLITNASFGKREWFRIGEVKNAHLGNDISVLETGESVYVESSGVIHSIGNLTFQALVGEDGALFSSGTALILWKGGGEKVIREFDESVRFARPYSSGFYVATESRLYTIDLNGDILKSVKITAEGLWVINDDPVILNRLVDDEGGKHWIFTFLAEDGEKKCDSARHFTYIMPRDVRKSGSFLFFWDDKHVHLVNRTLHIIINNTFESVAASDEGIILLNGESIFYLRTSSIAEELVCLGEDYDLDWIPNSTDPDDDNDGMPDSWEIKYHLNPTNPADANMDPDGDGLTNYQEYLNGTSPINPDTDGDGLSDGYEVMHGLNPLVKNGNEEIKIDFTTWVVILLFALLFLLGIKKER